MKEQIKQTNWINIFKWVPIYATFVVLPFIVKYHLYESRLSDYSWSPPESTNPDIYLYCKQNFFLIIAGMLLMLLVLLLYKGNHNLLSLLSRHKLLITLPGLYLLLALVSSLLSKNKKAAFMGSDAQFSSIFVLIGYILLVWYLFLLIQTEKDVKKALVCLLICIIEVSVIGIIQYCKFDFFSWKWFQNMTLPAGYIDAVGEVEAVFEEDRVSLFAHNPNYAGVFLSMLSSFCLALIVTEQKRKYQLLESILLITLLTSLIGTGSKAGLLVFFSTACLCLLFFIRKLLNKWYLVIPAITALVLLLSLFIQYKEYPIIENVKRALTLEKENGNPLQEMITTENGIMLEYKEVSFLVSFGIDTDDFYVEIVETSDNKETKIPLKLSENMEYYYLEHSVLEDVYIYPGIINESVPAISINLNNKDWYFVKIENPNSKTYYYLNPYGTLEELQHVEKIGFSGYERFASTRGLIWSMTVPLLKKTIFLGNGADSFAASYPQNNYKDMFYYFGEIQVTTRPHCMYLQIAVETGVLSLISLLAFWGIYILNSICFYAKCKFKNILERVGFSCFLAVIAFLICGLTNDAMITVAPVFWGILGIGYATNHIIISNKIVFDVKQ